MKLRRFASFAGPIALVFALASSAAPVFAQPSPAPAVQAVAETPAGPATSAEAGPEPAEHHAEVKLFGRAMGPVAQFMVMVFNFALFAGLLFFLLKGALATAFKTRSKELEDKLSQAERDKAEAQAQIQELEARMAGLQQELEGIMAKADVDAEAEKNLILESAKAEAAQILQQTRVEIEAQQRQAEVELRALVAGLVVAGAAQRLETRVQGAVAAQVLDRAIDQVGGAK